MSKQAQIKVIAVGDSGVGKSSILLRFANDQFSQFSQPTLGAAYLSKIHHYGNGKTARLQMWDTAGQEKYKSIAQIYYRDSQVALCVYDITNKNSFEVMKNWIQQLKVQGPKDLILAIIGNKTDLIDNEKVPYDVAKEYARSQNAIFKLVSAKQGKGIDELFTVISEQLQAKVINKKSQNLQDSSGRGVTLNKKDNKDQEKKRKCC